MTDDELDYIADLKDRFWLEFLSLCDRYIQEAADHFPSLTGPRYQEYITNVIMQLGESTSIYGKKAR